MMLSKLFKKAVVAALVVAASVGVAGCGGGDATKEKFINIATGGTAGTYYPIGGAIAEVLNKEIDGMNAGAQSTGASIANIKLLKDEQVELAIVQNDIAYYAANGKEFFDSKIRNFRGVAALYPETCQFVTLESSGIKSVSQLRGKRIAVGAAGSGAEANARQILQVYGMTYDDIDEQFLSFSEGATALIEGNVDAAFLTAGYPTASVQDIAAKQKIRILPIDEEKITELGIDYPFYNRTTIPAGVYRGFDEEVTTVNVMAILVASDRIDQKSGYDITAAIFNNLDKIATAHSAAKQITKSGALKGMDFIEMNAGALKFFRENAGE